MERVNRLVAAVLTVTMFTGCAATIGTSPKGLEVPIERAALKFAGDVKDGGYKVVTTDELKKWLDDGQKINIISTLTPAEDRQYGTLPGAANAAMPKAESDLTPEDREHLRMAAGEDKNRVQVVYCGFVACRKSHVGAKLLIDNGYKNVYRYPAGIAGWTETGLPLVK